MSVTEKLRVVETIDMTPTWEAIMPMLIIAVRDGTPTGQHIAEEELMRLARLADQHNASNR